VWNGQKKVVEIKSDEKHDEATPAKEGVIKWRSLKPSVILDMTNILRKKNIQFA
jgi:hypothetical protein